MPTEDFDTDTHEDVDLHQVIAGGMPSMHIGIGQQTGTVFIRGDLHPLGSATALLKAAGQHIPYIAVTAVEVLYPSDWLRAECLHDRDRLRIIENIEAFARSGFSQGAKVTH